MLVCPRCQFENPTANKFCQKCGTSLTYNTCPDCDSPVLFEQMHCQECGAIAGVMWWAIIVTNQPAPVDIHVPDNSLATVLHGYLDLQQRYQLLEPLPPPNELGEQQTKVLDCQPFQLSLLETLVLPQQTSEEMEFDFDRSAVEEDAEIKGWSESMDAMAVPAIAKPYVALRNQFYHALPAIHNAWQWNERSIFLVEDRSEFPFLMDFWCTEQPPLPLLQVLQWLYNMAELWEALAPWDCQQSLLVISNLRIDTDEETLCLQRLYPNPPDRTPTLQDLGCMWQAMFAESQKIHLKSISQILTDIDNKTLVSAEAVRSRIEAIAQALQPDLPNPNEEAPTEMNPDNGLSQPNNSQESDSATPTRIEPPSNAAGSTSEDSQFDNDEIPTIVLPMQLFNLEEIGRTDVGRQRDHNEDYFGIETQVTKVESPSGKTIHARNLYILCDGMGGHAGGEVASALAVDTVRKFFKEKWQETPFPNTGANRLPDVATLSQAVLLANQAIYDVNQQNARSGSGRMGTTLVMLLIYDTEVAVAHVGDSRLYRYTRKRGMEQITVDHEVGQREIQRGVDPEVAYARPDAYQLTQALGPRDEHFVKPDVQFFELNEDMLLLLCSDGLSDNDLLEKHWESHVQPLLSSQTNLDKGVSQLIELANRYNGHDNVTAIAIRAKVRPSLDHLR
ncbi:MAG: serine/threonine phosphatase [Leptolyngbyaceae cyanobacterium RU_5_1]|nr:serine/threonine phosphatase [Leptolyngbyaceae cyanobacterium RU_5_1]